MWRRSAFIVLTAVLVLTACGASRPTPPSGAALAADIHAGGGMFMTPGWKVSCVGRTACTVTWKQRVHDLQEGWVIMLPEFSDIDGDPQYNAIRHLTLDIVDPQTRRVTSFACVLTHKNGNDLKKVCVATQSIPF